MEIAGIVPEPDGAWMEQVARNLTDAVEGFLKSKRYLIHDRDPRFTVELFRILKAAGVESVKLPARSPNLNSCAERFVLSIKSECLNWMIFFGEAQLHRAGTGPAVTGVEAHGCRNALSGPGKGKCSAKAYPRFCKCRQIREMRISTVEDRS